MALRLNGGYKNRTHPAPLLEVDQAALQETQRWPLSRADLSQCAVLWKHKHSQEHAEGEKPSAPHFSHTVERLKKKHLCSSELGQQSVGLSRNQATCGPDLPRSQHRIECCSLREMDLLCSFTCSFVKHFGLLMCVNCARNKPVLPRLEKAVKRACVFAYVFFLLVLFLRRVVSPLQSPAKLCPAWSGPLETSRGTVLSPACRPEQQTVNIRG